MDRARVWRDLRAWIDQHEMADRESVTSILTVEQQLLINGLLSSQDNSESDDQNYIGKLHGESSFTLTPSPRPALSTSRD